MRSLPRLCRQRHQVGASALDGRPAASLVGTLILSCATVHCPSEQQHRLYGAMCRAGAPVPPAASGRSPLGTRQALFCGGSVFF